MLLLLLLLLLPQVLHLMERGEVRGALGVLRMKFPPA
jgi:hypothetical protein